METITLTFGDCAENHRGMQAIGGMAESGLSSADLEMAKLWFEKKGKVCEMIDLRGLLPEGEKEKAGEAFLLIVKNGCDVLVDPVALISEQNTLERDTKAFMYGRVVNKKARHNLCFSDFNQAAEYEKKKGTVVSFERLPILSKIRSLLPEICGKKVENLQCEANYYYDVKKTYIGFHGDTERRIVVAFRLGAAFPIHYQWFKELKPMGVLLTKMLNGGDVYFMSEKAVGFDWKKKKIYTLRHAAGAEKLVKKWK